jgi:hypothetical protein
VTGALALALSAAVLCEGGRPVVPVTVGSGASARTRAAAADLAASLGRVCGSPFAVETGDGSRGVALGTAADFPALGLSGAFDAEEPMRREQYVLRSHKDGLIAVGATDAAVEAAAADILHRAGWRRFFPGPSWEIVPRDPGLTLEASVKAAPSFAARRIWYDFGMSDYNGEAFRAWQRRNRVPGAFDLQTGHSAESLIERHKAVFDAHPEYLALSGGSRTSTKLCLSNPALRRLVVDDALDRLAKDPKRDTISVEPSDHEGWCECEACRALGAPADRVLLLANEVAAAIGKAAPGRYAAFYAYNRHAVPSEGRVGPGVIVSVATSYLPKGREPEELLEVWRGRGAALLGLREYYGIFAWHRSLPARSRGADLGYLARTLPRFHALGVRLVSAESGEDWGANGLGYYAASRILWDISEAGRVDAIREDFLTRSFGPAAAPMRRFYALLDGSRGLKKTKVPSGLVPEMYRLLAEAAAATDDPAVRSRLDDLVLYTRYVELHEAYRTSVLGRQDAFAALVRHARRTRGRMMVHLKALLKDVPRRDRFVSVPEDDGAGDYSPAEVAELLRR